MAAFRLTENGNVMTIQQGATFSLSVNYAAVANLSSGYTARMQGRATHDAASTIFSLTSSDGITLGSSSPNIVITMAAPATDDFTAPSSGVYDLELVQGSNVYRVLEGAFEITPEVTR
jgi:uncharacterized membrane protein